MATLRAFADLARLLPFAFAVLRARCL